jgi:predicted dehydrogenase
MSRRFTRRTFIKSIAYAGAVAPLAAPKLLRAASPAGKVNLAFIGAMGQARFSFDNLLAQNIVAIADVDAANLDARRELLRKDADHAHDPRLYRDYRQMLDKEQRNIDAFIVATPDHQHAPAALRGMALGKHCYCEKPLAHTLHEVRLMREVASRHKLVTQMGTQIHATDNYRRVVEKIQAGIIGAVKEVHVWLYGRSYYGAAFPSIPDPVPASLDWDLWLGPAQPRPYYEKLYHPFEWRGWWDFGGGTFTDMACHWVDLPHWALGLREPQSALAHAPPPEELRPPKHAMIEMRHAALGDRPAVTVIWHHGGTHIDRINVYERYGIDNKKYPGSKTCFVGTNGILLADYTRHDLLPEDKFRDVSGPEQTIPPSAGHHAEWLQGIREGTPTQCNFDYSGALTEAVLLGAVSHRAGNVQVTYDAASGRVTGAPAAQRWATKAYRRGWDVEKLI